MQLTLLGTGTAVPSLSRSSSAYLVQAAGKNILVDGGEGTIRRLLEVGISYQDIDIILITHRHPDHTADLTALLFACRYHGAPRRRELAVVGASGTRDFFGKLNEAFGGHLISPHFDLTVREVGEEAWSWQGLNFSAAPVQHAASSLAYRMEHDGKSIAFSGDSDDCPKLIRLAHKAGVFVCERALPDEKKAPGHLTPSLVGKVAAAADVGALVLSHFYPEVEQAPIKSQVRKNYAGKLILGTDLMRIG
ncbi:MAG: ribonuclease Z [Mariprofundaceae bacterium]